MLRCVSCEFRMGEWIPCGQTALNSSTTGAMRFYMDGTEYPLEGTIELTARLETGFPNQTDPPSKKLTEWSTTGKVMTASYKNVAY